MLVYDGWSDWFAEGVDILGCVNPKSKVYEHKYLWLCALQKGKKIWNRKVSVLPSKPKNTKKTRAWAEWQSPRAIASTISMFDAINACR